MATTKEYKDLQQAASIADDALVATAEPNATELQTSTVTAFAQKIQEINTDGPLAELELATSIGKQQLAEALTEKGVVTTSSETLVQMADKLRGLTTNDALTFIKGSILSSNSNSLNIPTDIRDFAVIPNVHDHFVVHAGQALHIIPRGNYPDLPAMIGASVSDVAAHSYTSTNVRMGRSADGNTIVVVYGTNTSMDIYDIDWSGDTPVISYVKTVTIPFSLYNTAWKPGITNDRELATASDSSYGYMSLFLVNDTTVYKMGRDDLYIQYIYQDQIYFDINEQKEGYLYTAGNASSSGDSRTYKSTKIKYVPTTPEATGSITIENPGQNLYPIGTTAGPSAFERSSFIDFDSGLLIRTYCINYYNNYTSSRTISGQLSVLNLKDESKQEALTSLNTYACAVNPGQGHNYGITTAGLAFQNRPALCVYGFPVIKKSSTTWQLSIPQFEQDEIVYDSIASVLSRTKTSCALANDMSGNYRFEILLSANTNGYMYAYTYVNSSYYGQANVLAKDVITMVHLNFNNTPVDLPITAIKSDEINGLKTETVSVTLPESDTQEGN